MTITQFVDKWAPTNEGPAKVLAFTHDLEALLTDQLTGLQELLIAIEGTERPS